MGIFSRVRDIVEANIASLLDRAEDPRKTVRLVIEEMEKALVGVRREVARVLADLKEADRVLERQRRAAEEWGEKAEFALVRGREDLARAALVEQQKTRRLLATLKEETMPLRRRLQELEEDLGNLNAKLREARAREASISSRLGAAASREEARLMTSGARVKEAFSRFATLERRADLAEGQAEAVTLGSGDQQPGQGLHAEDRSAPVEWELERLKAKLRRTGDPAPKRPSGEG